MKLGRILSITLSTALPPHLSCSGHLAVFLQVGQLCNLITNRTSSTSILFRTPHRVPASRTALQPHYQPHFLHIYLVPDTSPCSFLQVGQLPTALPPHLSCSGHLAVFLQVGQLCNLITNRTSSTSILFRTPRRVPASRTALQPHYQPHFLHIYLVPDTSPCSCK
ncbi:hypothetical protein J6590_018997 [Homalodisca vitripennis]|nr:hypothetical protein J6590_018997 [Homalodisca vitripennis]